MDKKILIIEDEESVTYSMDIKFGLIPDLKIFHAKNGEDGLKIALKEKPDLIILDIIMPKMDGIEMLKQLRQDSWGKNTDVMVLSNLSNQDKESEAKNLGVKDYIIKANYNLNDIMDRVINNLKK